MPTAKAYAVVLAVALAASVTALRNGFVYDDVQVIVENPRLHALDSLPSAVASPYWSPAVVDRLYRPVTSATFVIDWVVGGGRPFVFHAVNLALHLGVVALVLTLAGAVLGRGAVVAALWFAVHPVHVEVVANAVGRSELLAAAGYLAAVLAYGLEGRAAGTAPSGGWRAALAAMTLAGAALAFGAKEHALSLPVALLATDAWVAWRVGRSVGGQLRVHAVTWLGVAGLGGAYLLLRHGVLGTAFGGGAVGAGLYGLTLVERGTVMLPVALLWVRLLAFPLHLSADYAPNAIVPQTAFGAAHAVALLLLLAVVVGSWRLRRRAPGLLAGVVLFAVTVAVASNVVVPTGVLFAERLLYLPSVGAALAVGALWELLPAHRVVWPLTAAALALLAARSLSRIPVWRTPERFFEARAHDAPDSYRTHWERGGRAFERGEARAGERELLRAVDLWPYDPELLEELGGRYLAAGLDAPAVRFSRAALALDSSRDAAATAVIVALTRLGRPDSAAAFADLVLARGPRGPEVSLAAIAAYGAREPLRALARARVLTYRFPGVYAYQHVAADAAERAGLCDEARRRFALALGMALGPAARAEIARRLEGAAACGRGPR